MGIWIFLFTIGTAIVLGVVFNLAGQNQQRITENKQRITELRRQDMQLQRQSTQLRRQDTEIQESRILLCRQTYEGIREVFRPFFPPKKGRTAEQQKDLDKFNNTVDDLKTKCDKGIDK